MQKDPLRFTSVYPEPQERTGMAARQPTVFRVPVVKLSLLLFVPVALAMILPSLYIDWNVATMGSPAFNTVVLSVGIAVVTITSVVVLSSAYRIITRNCTHPYIIQALYFLVVVPLSVLLISHFPLSLRGVAPEYYVFIQSGLIYIMSLGLSLLASALSRL